MQVLVAERAADSPRWSAVRRALAAPEGPQAARALPARITGTLCEVSGTRIGVPERESAGAAGRSPSRQPSWRVAQLRPRLDELLRARALASRCPLFDSTTASRESTRG